MTIRVLAAAVPERGGKLVNPIAQAGHLVSNNMGDGSGNAWVPLRVNLICSTCARPEFAC